MASKMSKKDVDSYIKSKSVTQDTYQAPTVKVNVDTKENFYKRNNIEPAMAKVSQTVKNETPKSTNTLGKAIKNSAVKNYGFNLSNLITDVANIGDAALNTAETMIPGLNNARKTAKTVGNVSTNMAEGALKNLEGIGDWAASINPTDAVSAWAIEKIYGKKAADKFRKESEESTKNFVKRNLVNEFEDKTGFAEIKPEWEKDSLVRSDNFGGQVSQGIGGMVPALVAGQYLGFDPKMASTKGLSGLSKLKAIGGNIAKDALVTLPSKSILGASSYGSGVEEALQDDKIDLKTAKKFGLANMASELGTEMITGGVPGLQGYGGLDFFADSLIDKVGSGYLKDALKFGYKSFGEGTEEYINAYLNALAKQNILGQEQNWDDVRNEARQAGLVGMATGAILDSPSIVNDVQTTTKNKARQNLSREVISNNISKINSFNDVEFNALVDITNKVKQGQQLSVEDMTTLQYLNSKDAAINNVVDSKRNQMNPTLEVQQNVVQSELAKEIQNKTIKNIKDTKNIQMININELSPMIKDGGYRTQEQMSSLIDDIKQNGITKPIEIEINDGVPEIYNGNHRLMAALELGLTDIPVKIVDNSIENNLNNNYNENKVDYYDRGENNAYGNRNEINRLNEGIETGERYGTNNSIITGDGASTTTNDTRINSIQKHNDGASSVASSEGNIKGQQGIKLANNQNVLYNENGKASDIDGRRKTSFDPELARRSETEFNQRDGRSESSDDRTRSNRRDGSLRVLKENKNYNQIKQTIDNLKATHKRGAFFDSYSVDELKTFKTYQTPDGKSSISVKPDGDITALVSEGNKGMATDLLMTARENGGTKMDCYGKFLKELYEKNGFEAVARVHYGRGFNEQMDAYVDNAIKEGKATSDSDFDIYFMMKNTDDIDTVKKNIGKYTIKDIESLPYMEYDDAYKFRDDLLAKQEQGEGSTRNKNIPAKKDDNIITIKNKKGQEVKLKRDNNNPNLFEREQPKTYGKSVVSQEMIDKQVAKLKDGTKVSNLYSNVTENSKFITQENMSKLSQEDIWQYAPQTNKETMENAIKEIGDTQKSLENSYADFLSKSDNFTPEDVAKGWIYLKRFQDAGNYDAMVQVAKKMRNIATKSGQTVQMFNIESRLTPEGMVKYAQSELMEAEQKYNKGKSKKQIEKAAKNFELTGDEVEFIKTQMEKIQGMEDGRAKNIEMAKINQMLSDKLPHQKGDSIKGWMRLSMLFNPKTQVRNIFGNALITPINALSDIPGALVDTAISKKTGVRTLGAPSLESIKTYAEGFKRGGVEAWQDYKMGIDTKDVDMTRFDINQGKPFVDSHEGLASVLNPISKGLNWTNDLLDLAMSGGDRIFYQGVFDSSLRNQMVLNGVDTPTQDMIDIARQEALSRTWNDSNGYTQFVLNTRRALNKVNAFGYGLGDVLIPFAKTPANLTKAIVDYSPVGMVDAIFKTKDIKNAIDTGQITPQMQHDFAQKLGKGVAGTMLYGLAYALAKNGITTGSGDDDKDVANFIRNTMGIQPYSIKIGDKSFTYDWAQPVAAPIAIAADAYNNLTRKSDESLTKRVMNTMLDVGNTGINVLMEQSFLQGISEVLNNNEGVANGIMEQVMGLPARAIPTFAQQINNMFDKTQRTSFEKDEPITTAWNQVKSKTPLSKDLAPKVDTLGNEVQRYGGDKNNITYAIKNFLSPTNQSNKQPSIAADEIYEVYQATGDKTIMPMVAPYYIQNKAVGRVDLDSKDRAEYQKISGKLVNDAIVDLTNNKDYNKLSYDEKAEVINGIVTYANAKAKEHFTGYMANTYNAANKKINNGMSIADYYLEKTQNKR